MRKLRFDKLLTPREAASLLQPHLPNGDVAQWLEHDRQTALSRVPFVSANNETKYWLSDITWFAFKFLKAVPQFYELPSDILVERRSPLARRSGVEKRKQSPGSAPPASSPPVVERRTKDDIDRRLRGEIDRRGMPVRAIRGVN